MKLFLIGALIGAHLVSSISLAPRSASPRAIGLDIQRKSTKIIEHDRKRLARRTGTVSLTLDNEETLYFADCTLGTPAQSLRLHIDTGSSDLWVNVANSTLCSSSNECDGGTYSPTDSSTYKFVNNQFNISYVDGTGSSGDYVTDTLSIGDVSLTEFQFGVGFTSSSAEGVLGIGYVSNEVQVNRAGLAAYPNLPQAMAQSGLIASNAYSLWLNDLDASTGTILFGGVNTDKYHGELATVPIIKEYGSYYEFIIALTSVSVNTTGSITSFASASSLPSAALLDSGSSLVYLPNDITEDIYNAVNAVYDSSQGVAYVECSLANNDSTIDFSFSGATIQVAYNELVLDVAASSNGQPLTFQNGQEACVFGIAPAQGSTPVLGDTFLRSAYVVYDLENNEISLAQTNFNSTSDSIQDITKDGSVPGATVVATPVTSVASGTAGARIATTSTGSLSSGALSTEVPITVMGSTLALLVVAFFFASL